MIQRVEKPSKRKTHKNQPKNQPKKFEGAEKNMPDFKPEWINAFMIAMLHKVGGTQSITLEHLKEFDELTASKQPEFSWDGETHTFTLKAPAYDMPLIVKSAKKKLIKPVKKKIITNLSEA